MLRKLFGLERQEMTGDVGNTYNEECHNVYCTPGIIRVTEIRRMGLAGHVARVGEKRNAYLGIVRETNSKS